MALDLTPASGKFPRARTFAPPPRRVDRSQPQRRVALPVLRSRRRTAGDRSQQQLLRALAQLPAARRGQALRQGRDPLARPSLPGRVRPPAPILDRLLAGEYQRRLLLALAGVMLFVVVIVALGASFFV